MAVQGWDHPWTVPYVDRKWYERLRMSNVSRARSLKGTIWRGSCASFCCTTPCISKFAVVSMKMFPKPPTSAIDWSSIGFQSFDQTSHIESVWSQETEEWSEPRIVRDPWVKVHGLSPALNYGQQCYEGMRACRSSDDQIVLFRPREHAKRMVRSASVVSIPPVPEEIFMLCVQAAVIHNSEFVPPHNGRAALYIRPVVFGSGPQLMLAPPAEFTFCVFVHPAPAMHGEDALDAIVLEDFDRAAPRGVGHAKVGGNYAPVMKWSSKAQEDGFMLTLHLDSATRTEIDEFSSCAFAGIKTCEGRTTLVVPDSPSIVESITADSCMEIARRLGWMVERRRVSNPSPAHACA